MFRTIRKRVLVDQQPKGGNYENGYFYFEYVDFCVWV